MAEDLLACVKQCDLTTGLEAAACLASACQDACSAVRHPNLTVLCVPFVRFAFIELHILNTQVTGDDPICTRSTAKSMNMLTIV